MYSFLNCSNINLYTSFLSSLDNRYTFPFLSTNISFVLIAWFYNSLVGILSLAFLPKIWIHLWKHSGTIFFTSFFDFTTFSFLPQISYSSATFFYLCCSLCFGFFFFFPAPSLLIYFSLSLFFFPTLIFLISASIVFHTLLDISSFLLLLFFN